MKPAGPRGVGRRSSRLTHESYLSERTEPLGETTVSRGMPDRAAPACADRASAGLSPGRNAWHECYWPFVGRPRPGQALTPGRQTTVPTDSLADRRRGLGWRGELHDVHRDPVPLWSRCHWSVRCRALPARSDRPDRLRRTADASAELVRMALRRPPAMWSIAALR